MTESISCFEMKNFRALNTLTIYLNTSKTSLYRNTRIQINLSKNNRFSAEEATNYIPRTEKRKKVPVCEILEFSGSLSSSTLPILQWKLKIKAYRGSTTSTPSSKLDLLCQHEMTFIVIKSSTIDDLGVRDRL